MKTAKELKAEKKKLREELERQKLEREVDQMRKKAHPSALDRTATLITTVFAIFSDEDEKKGKTHK